MREYEKGVLVFDIGSGNFKAGLANEPEPTSAFPTIIGNPKHQVFIKHLHEVRRNFFKPIH